ncbi:MAG TPA: MaoC/PaaZ C-terminal domain-containing protein [Hyphomicrobiaceae bacterium]|nr:MaoC/PaaZ C-terminal domain-containing protein [Hyphomicrobiaceae bacterium]
MPIDPEKLRSWKIADVQQTYTERDTMLYALGLGCGADPLDERDLTFVYEDGLKALPTMAAVLGSPGFWVKNPETGVDWKKVVHGEQSVTLLKPIPKAATIIGRTRITGLIDKGRDKGALLLSEREVIDKTSGTTLARLQSTSFLRGDGGFGNSTGTAPEIHALPTRKPDEQRDMRTLPQAALIYRLSGDYNPLHADPKVGAAAGFRAPILHGLCSFGIAGRAVLAACCGDDPARLTHMQVRFSAPIYPGETIRTEIWRDGATISFRARCLERDVVILNNGMARVA